MRFALELEIDRQLGGADLQPRRRAVAVHLHGAQLAALHAFAADPATIHRMGEHPASVHRAQIGGRYAGTDDQHLQALGHGQRFQRGAWRREGQFAVARVLAQRTGGDVVGGALALLRQHGRLVRREGGAHGGFVAGRARIEKRNEQQAQDQPAEHGNIRNKGVPW